MAYSSIPKPGSLRGPCKDECKHRDCNEAHRIAGERCALCSDEIGFERNFCDRLDGIESPRHYVHLLCAELWADEQQRAKKVALKTTADVFELIDPVDPDSICKRSNGEFELNWLDGGFTRFQFLRLKDNPKIVVIDGPYMPKDQTAITHQIRIKVL